MRIEVKAKVHPSEDPNKVSKAIKNIFPSLDLEVSEELVKGKSTDLESLENLKNKLGLQGIRDSARSRIKKKEEENSIRFLLNRQAAFVSKVSFSDGDTPLGPIKVSIESGNPDDLIDYLTPSKKNREN